MQKAYGAGKQEPLLPDIIPGPSDIFQQINQGQEARENATKDQLELFEDFPELSLFPALDRGELIGAFGIVHKICDREFISVIGHEIALVLSVALRNMNHLAGIKLIEQDSRDKLTNREREVLNRCLCIMNG